MGPKASDGQQAPRHVTHTNGDASDPKDPALEFRSDFADAMARF
jgi:hypothetical protein